MTYNPDLTKRYRVVWTQKSTGVTGGGARTYTYYNALKEAASQNVYQVKNRSEVEFTVVLS